jgi:predicted dehydrogenase
MKWWPPGHIIGYEHTFVHIVHDLMQSLARNQTPSPDFHDGVENQRVVEAIQKSAQSRQWISLRPRQA